MTADSATADDHALDGDVLDAVGEDSDLLPAEKETTIRFAKRDGTAVVSTAEAGLARRLLAHPRAALRSAHVDGADAKRNVETADALDSLADDETIVGVVVDVPVALLLIQLYPRESDQHAGVVTSRALDHAGGGGSA